MGRELILKRINAFIGNRCRSQILCGISHPLEWLSPTLRQIVHALLTRSPLPLRGARLACMKHAISVRSEPGSNSPYDPFAFFVRNSIISEIASRRIHPSVWRTGRKPGLFFTVLDDIPPCDETPSTAQAFSLPMHSQGTLNRDGLSLPKIPR